MPCLALQYQQVATRGQHNSTFASFWVQGPERHRCTEREVKVLKALTDSDTSIQKTPVHPRRKPVLLNVRLLWGFWIMKMEAFEALFEDRAGALENLVPPSAWLLGMEKLSEKAGPRALRSISCTGTMSWKPHLCSEVGKIQREAVSLSTRIWGPRKCWIWWPTPQIPKATPLIRE